MRERSDVNGEKNMFEFHEYDDAISLRSYLLRKNALGDLTYLIVAFLLEKHGREVMHVKPMAEKPTEQDHSDFINEIRDLVTFGFVNHTEEELLAMTFEVMEFDDVMEFLDLYIGDNLSPIKENS